MHSGRAISISSRFVASVAAVILVSGCGGGGGGGGTPGGGAQTYSIGGTTSGLASGTSVVLQNNSGDDLTVSGNGSFGFATKLANNASYNVTVKTQPTGQTCTVNSGAGNVSGADVTIVTVSCGGGSSLTSIADGTQATAQALSQVVNDNVATVIAAHASMSVPIGASIVGLPTGSTINQTLNCADMSTAAGGSGTISIQIVSDDTTHRPSTATLSYNNCVLSIPGETTTFNGTAAMTYTWVSATNYSFSLVFNVTYSSTGTTSSSGTVNGSETCTYNGGTASCSVNIGNSTVSNISMSTSGTTTTITTATVNTDGTTVVDNLTITYSGWVWLPGQGHATSGTATVTDSNGNHATIVASASGYDVTIVINGTTYHYTITFG